MNDLGESKIVLINRIGRYRSDVESLPYLSLHSHTHDCQWSFLKLLMVAGTLLLLVVCKLSFGLVWCPYVLCSSKRKDTYLDVYKNVYTV